MDKIDLKMNVKNCARCGGDHWMVFNPFQNPAYLPGGVFTHWAMCPVTQEPVLLMITEDEDIVHVSVEHKDDSSNS